MINKDIQFKFKHDFTLDPLRHGNNKIGTTCPGGIDNTVNKRHNVITVGLDFLKCKEKRVSFVWNKNTLIKNN
tara:strand:+ start:783 stop:1001 length:219 start_codon:yes stop_codon:yes gene_type:complete